MLHRCQKYEHKDPFPRIPFSLDVDDEPHAGDRLVGIVCALVAVGLIVAGVLL